VAVDVVVQVLPPSLDTWIVVPKSMPDVPVPLESDRPKLLATELAPLSARSKTAWPPSVTDALAMLKAGATSLSTIVAVPVALAFEVLPEARVAVSVKVSLPSKTVSSTRATRARTEVWPAAMVAVDALAQVVPPSVETWIVPLKSAPESALTLASARFTPMAEPLVPLSVMSKTA
jgi:hypothetical protein